MNIGHPVSPDGVALAVGAPGNTFSDRGMLWDTPARTASMQRYAGRTFRDARGEKLDALGQEA